MTSVTEEEKVRRIEYLCSKCGSEDTMKLWPAEPIPPAVNCWKCGAGRGVDTATSLQSGVGMFQKPADEATSH